MRPGAKYERSLRVLQKAKEVRPDLKSKTGLMLGLGETYEELLTVFGDLRAVECDILTLGQYLRPSKDQLPVERYVHPDEFASLRKKRSSSASATLIGLSVARTMRGNMSVEWGKTGSFLLLFFL